MMSQAELKGKIIAHKGQQERPTCWWEAAHDPAGCACAAFNRWRKIHSELSEGDEHTQQQQHGQASGWSDERKDRC